MYTVNKYCTLTAKFISFPLDIFNTVTVNLQVIYNSISLFITCFYRMTVNILQFFSFPSLMLYNTVETLHSGIDYSLTRVMTVMKGMFVSVLQANVSMQL